MVNVEPRQATSSPFVFRGANLAQKTHVAEAFKINRGYYQLTASQSDFARGFRNEMSS
jgi:hypothetical protein